MVYGAQSSPLSAMSSASGSHASWCVAPLVDPLVASNIGYASIGGGDALPRSAPSHRIRSAVSMRSSGHAIECGSASSPTCSSQAAANCSSLCAQLKLCQERRSASPRQLTPPLYASAGCTPAESGASQSANERTPSHPLTSILREM
eukprot:scaffold32431_cov30-Tisochrysis_lutea.AAC.1